MLVKPPVDPEQILEYVQMHRPVNQKLTALRVAWAVPLALNEGKHD